MNPDSARQMFQPGSVCKLWMTDGLDETRVQTAWLSRGTLCVVLTQRLVQVSDRAITMDLTLLLPTGEVLWVPGHTYRPDRSTFVWMFEPVVSP